MFPRHAFHRAVLLTALFTLLASCGGGGGGGGDAPKPTPGGFSISTSAVSFTLRQGKGCRPHSTCRFSSLTLRAPRSARLGWHPSSRSPGLPRRSRGRPELRPRAVREQLGADARYAGRHPDGRNRRCQRHDPSDEADPDHAERPGADLIDHDADQRGRVRAGRGGQHADLQRPRAGRRQHDMERHVEQVVDQSAGQLADRQRHGDDHPRLHEPGCRRDAGLHHHRQRVRPVGQHRDPGHDGGRSARAHRVAIHDYARWSGWLRHDGQSAAADLGEHRRESVSVDRDALHGHGQWLARHDSPLGLRRARRPTRSR